MCGSCDDGSFVSVGNHSNHPFETEKEKGR